MALCVLGDRVFRLSSSFCRSLIRYLQPPEPCFRPWAACHKMTNLRWRDVQHRPNNHKTKDDYFKSSIMLWWWQVWNYFKRTLVACYTAVYGVSPVTKCRVELDLDHFMDGWSVSQTSSSRTTTVPCGRFVSYVFKAHFRHKSLQNN